MGKRRLVVVGVGHLGPALDHQRRKNVGRTVDITRRSDRGSGLHDIPACVKLRQPFDVVIKFVPGCRRARNRRTVKKIFVVIQGKRIHVHRHGVDMIILDKITRRNINKHLPVLLDRHERIAQPLDFCRHGPEFVPVLGKPGVVNQQYIRASSGRKGVNDAPFVLVIGKLLVNNRNVRMQFLELFDRGSECGPIIKNPPEFQPHVFRALCSQAPQNKHKGKQYQKRYRTDKDIDQTIGACERFEIHYLVNNMT